MLRMVLHTHVDTLWAGYISSKPTSEPLTELFKHMREEELNVPTVGYRDNQKRGQEVVDEVQQEAL